uniref:zinc finger CCCH domain-containing protein 15-like n=1 Tax=Oncorhynchus gorbuscha TaxID=8017 RepID=UPI001EAEBBFA|nr:zinc finger CCCH domain-containing protein 15-like [Oncorhynchus gorbuscha]
MSLVSGREVFEFRLTTMRQMIPRAMMVMRQTERGLVVEENRMNGEWDTEGDTEDVPVDENLFTGDYLDEEELDTLDLDQQDKGWIVSFFN